MRARCRRWVEQDQKKRMGGNGAGGEEGGREKVEEIRTRFMAQ